MGQEGKAEGADSQSGGGKKHTAVSPFQKGKGSQQGQRGPKQQIKCFLMGVKEIVEICPPVQAPESRQQGNAYNGKDLPDREGSPMQPELGRLWQGEGETAAPFSGQPPGQKASEQGEHRGQKGVNQQVQKEVQDNGEGEGVGEPRRQTG